jgi:hypothetical protein
MCHPTIRQFRPICRNENMPVHVAINQGRAEGDKKRSSFWDLTAPSRMRKMSAQLGSLTSLALVAKIQPRERTMSNFMSR